MLSYRDYINSKPKIVKDRELEVPILDSTKTITSKSTRQLITLSEFQPRFTFHSLLRLSQRIQEPRRRPVSILLNDHTTVTGQMLAKWINPRLITACIKDIKENMLVKSHYSEEEKRLLVRGTIAWYAMAKGKKGEIITLFRKPEHGYLKFHGYQLASKKFVREYFYLSKDKKSNSL